MCIECWRFLNIFCTMESDNKHTYVWKKSIFVIFSIWYQELRVDIIEIKDSVHILGIISFRVFAALVKENGNLYDDQLRSRWWWKWNISFFTWVVSESSSLILVFYVFSGMIHCSQLLKKVLRMFFELPKLVLDKYFVVYEV